MYCPHCADTTLTMTERHGIEIDYCPKCRGVWLDRGELDKIVERAAGAAAPPRPAAPPPAPARPPEYSEPRRDSRERYDERDRDRDRDRDYRRPERDHDHDYHGHGHGQHPHKRRREGFLADLFDFD